MFVYCLNNPVNYMDSEGKNAEALSWWASTMWWLCGVDAVLPIGDIIYGVGIVCLGIYTFAMIEESYEPAVLTKTKIDVDPYGRAGQKKQGRELKNKSRQQDGFKSKNNRRDNKPARPKHHTPGREHQKHCQTR